MSIFNIRIKPIDAIKNIAMSYTVAMSTINAFFVLQYLHNGATSL